MSTSLLGFALLMKFRAFWKHYKETFTQSATANMKDMFIDPNILFMANIFAVIMIPLLLWLATGEFLIALGVFVALVVISTTIYKMMRSKRLKRFEEQLPDGLAMIAGGMRAGANLNIAMENLVKEQGPPLSQEFELFMREQRIGVDFDDSLDHMEKRLPV